MSTSLRACTSYVYVWLSLLGSQFASYICTLQDNVIFKEDVLAFKIKPDDRYSILIPITSIQPLTEPRPINPSHPPSPERLSSNFHWRTCPFRLQNLSLSLSVSGRWTMTQNANLSKFIFVSSRLTRCKCVCMYDFS